MAFQGYLLKSGDDVFPMEYCLEQSYKISRKILDLDSTRTAAGILERNVLPHTSTTISLTIRSLNNTQQQNLWSYIRNHYNKANERKIQLTYYVPELNSYETAYFYVPDPDFTIKEIDVNKKKIKYYQYSLEFIGY